MFNDSVLGLYLMINAYLVDFLNIYFSDAPILFSFLPSYQSPVNFYVLGTLIATTTAGTCLPPLTTPPLSVTPQRGPQPKYNGPKRTTSTWANVLASLPTFPATATDPSLLTSPGVVFVMTTRSSPGTPLLKAAMAQTIPPPTQCCPSLRHPMSRATCSPNATGPALPTLFVIPTTQAPWDRTWMCLLSQSSFNL